MEAADTTPLSPLGVINNNVQSTNEDQQFWCDVLAHPLASMLKSSQYSDENRSLYLRWFQKSVASFFGPRPLNGKPYYPSTFVYDGSPMEYSLNWKENSSKQTVRFTMEPCSRQAGTAADPLNDMAGQNMMNSLAKEEEMLGIDLSIFDLFLAESRVPHEKASEISSRLSPEQPRHRTLAAFDLERGKIVAKAYFNPELKALSSGISNEEVVANAMRKCNAPGRSYDACIQALHDYLKSTEDANEAAPAIPLFAQDCIPLSSSTRLKVYLVAPLNTLSKALDILSLGGRVRGPSMAEVSKTVTEFWHHIFDHSKAFPAAQEPCVFGFEMRPGPESQTEPDIEAKIYVLGSWLGGTDAEVCKVLSIWFRNHGHPEFADRYQADLAAAFPKHDFEKSGKLIHTWISLTWTKKAGCYMSMYYTPRLSDLD